LNTARGAGVTAAPFIVTIAIRSSNVMPLVNATAVPAAVTHEAVAKTRANTAETERSRAGVSDPERAKSTSDRRTFRAASPPG
jgi:hypothetical protein